MVPTLIVDAFKPYASERSGRSLKASGHDFETAVALVLDSLEPGEVVTYGEVALEAGYPGAARAVGNYLARGGDSPWWRVVNSAGRLVPGHEVEHRAKLAAEGVKLRNGRVPMRRVK